MGPENMHFSQVPRECRFEGHTLRTTDIEDGVEKNG